MSELNRHRSLNLLLVAVIVAVSVLGILKVLFQDQGEFYEPNSGIIRYSTRWTIQNGQEIDQALHSLPTVVVSENGKVSISKKVDHALLYYGGIAFASKEQIVKVYINNVPVYSMLQERGRHIATASSNMWHIVDLKGKVRYGDKLTIEYRSLDSIIRDGEILRKYFPRIHSFERDAAEFLYHRKYFSRESHEIKLNTIYLASRQSMFGHVFKHEVLVVGVGMLSFLLGFVVTAFGFLPYRNMKQQPHLTYLGLSMICMGLTQIVVNAMMSFVVEDVLFLNAVGDISELLLGICFLMYLIKSDIVHYYNVMVAQIGFLAGLIALKILIALTGIGVLIDVLILEEGILIGLAFINFYLFVFQASTKKRNSSYIILAFFVLLIFSSLGYLEGMPEVYHGSYFEVIGESLFFFILVLNELRHYAKVYEGSRSVDYYRELAERDTLTCLKNRTAFMEDLKIYRSDCRDLTVIAFDADNLKEINDNMGHSKGDEFLQTIASVIYRNLSDLGECYRMSGDEFVCVLEGAKPELVRLRLDRLRTDMIVESQRRGFNVNASFGVARFDPAQDARFEHVMRRADTYLYEEKRKKKYRNLIDDIVER